MAIRANATGLFGSAVQVVTFATSLFGCLARVHLEKPKYPALSIFVLIVVVVLEVEWPAWLTC
jgi:hypothetical protein